MVVCADDRHLAGYQLARRVRAHEPQLREESSRQSPPLTRVARRCCLHPDLPWRGYQRLDVQAWALGAVAMNPSEAPNSSRDERAWAFLFWCEHTPEGRNLLRSYDEAQEFLARVAAHSRATAALDEDAK